MKGIYKFRFFILEVIKEVYEYILIFEKMCFKGIFYIGGFVEGNVFEFFIVVEENFIFYNVDLNDGFMIGIFLD